MLAKRIIPCLDVKNGQVVKGVQFKNHNIVGDILELASFYQEAGADELVFYDITASCEKRNVSLAWIENVASTLSIPFTVAGGIKDRDTAKAILNAGADKISINSPALNQPTLINALADYFGNQCVVVGIDSLWVNDDYYVFKYTGDVNKTQNTGLKTKDWIQEVQARGAGEIVLNCMQADGMRQGYDIAQLLCMQKITQVPLIASGGAGKSEDFVQVFNQTQVAGALAASIFHQKIVTIEDLKKDLAKQPIRVRL